MWKLVECHPSRPPAVNTDVSPTAPVSHSGRLSCVAAVNPQAPIPTGRQLLVSAGTWPWLAASLAANIW